MVWGLGGGGAGGAGGFKPKTFLGGRGMNNINIFIDIYFSFYLQQNMNILDYYFSTALSKSTGNWQSCHLQSTICRLLHTRLNWEPSSRQGDLLFAAITSATLSTTTKNFDRAVSIYDFFFRFDYALSCTNCIDGILKINLPHAMLIQQLVLISLRARHLSCLS